jgi:circadian clock protein KaiB
VPEIFKGIALFTPGGDLIYCIDPSKRDRWHLHLCVALQELLGLSEPPHFLVPGYTATVDRWLDPQSQQLKTAAEVYPAVSRYQPLLNAIFGTHDQVWQVAKWQEETCNPIILETYRSQFPQLWKNHDAIVRLDNKQQLSIPIEQLTEDLFDDSPFHDPIQGYVLRLFVAGNDVATKRTLQMLHQVLEQQLQQPYTLKVIDILKHPELAEIDRISTTPTLIRVLPQPVRRVVGELDNLQRAIQIVLS